MIPVQLRLKNFLSYRDATLDFRGLHVACVCGANGAGKSSLLEAIAWVVWGQSRATTDDDVIHMGEVETQVTFTFICHQQSYRIIRTRYRKRGSALEFQVKTDTGYRTLTGRGMRATQDLIQHHIRLDYDTFINSAYLRQGRADEFMQKRPSERKQILSDLLKLNQYEALAEKARERSRQVKAELDAVRKTIESIKHQLNNEPAIHSHITQLEDKQAALQHQQNEDHEQLKVLCAQQQQRQAWSRDQTLLQQQYQYMQQESDRLQQETVTLHHQCQALDAVIDRAEVITHEYHQFQALQREEEHLSDLFQQHQHTYQRYQTLKQEHSEAIAHIHDQLRTVDGQLEVLTQQQQEIEHIVQKRGQVDEGLAYLRDAKQQLARFDHRQTQAVPLIQRKQQIQQYIQQQHIRLSTQLDDLQSSTNHLERRQTEQTSLQQELTSLISQLEYLEKRRHYQQQVRERGIERRSFMERLQERQRELERQLAEVDHKLHWLKSGTKDDAGIKDEAERDEIISPGRTTFPPCPVCDRPLDAQHWQNVLTQQDEEHREIRSQLWVIREQLSASEKEIQILRQEYCDLERELAAYDQVLQHQGRVYAQLQTAKQNQQQLETLLHQKAKLERSLQQDDHSLELREELQAITQTLDQLQYDERNHALARGQVDRWRWAEIKAAEIQQAEKRRSHLNHQQHTLEAERKQLHVQLNNLQGSDTQQNLDALEQDIQRLSYDAERHAQVRKSLRQMQASNLHYQELQQAQQQRPILTESVQAIVQRLEHTLQESQALKQKITDTQHHLSTHPDCQASIDDLETQIQQRRSHLDEAIAQLGRLQQQQQQFDALNRQYQEYQQQQQHLHYQTRIYQELTTAFGKNGIQALMIENILPQLETESNRILGQLSGSQLHIQFVTQRVSKSQTRASRKIATKLIDTLDILIADTQGTRSYETYSGGEAFRVNFSIRLALARLLAQRSGTALQMLIIDEGFGTQDQQGCDRLVSAINAIASDFACILTVTHMPHLKEAFQTRIEVTKDTNGSSLSLIR